MANRDVHVFDNTIDGNGSAAVLLVAYLNAFKDPIYNPLPRDVAVHGNRIGRNGFDPKFEGGPVLAKLLGGAIPPVMWDGVIRYKKADGTLSTDPVRLLVSDGPVVNLNLKDQGTPVTSANPSVATALGDAPLVEPKPVVLPAGMIEPVVAKHPAPKKKPKPKKPPVVAPAGAPPPISLRQ